MSPKSLPKLELLQALRALAALSVVFFHTYYKPGFGAFGVSVFFVISGYIMAMLLQVETSTSRFMLRRIIRVAPLYWVTTTFISILLWWRTGGAIPATKDYIMSLCFIPFQQPNGQIQPVLGPGWTLNYEMAFYLSCAVGLMLSVRYSAIASVGIVSVWLLLAQLSATTLGIFFGSPVVILFLLGVAIFEITKRFKWRSNSFVGLGLLFILCLGMAWAEKSMDSNAVSLLGQLLAALTVACAVFFEPALSRLSPHLSRRCVEIGEASYAIYLTHLFVIYLFAGIAKKLDYTNSSLALALLTVVAATAVGILVHKAIDLPIQNGLKKLTQQ